MKIKINNRNVQAELIRSNPVKAWIYRHMFNLSGFARIPIEVHTRKSFGERYFSFSSSLITLFCFGIYPFIAQSIFTSAFSRFGIPEVSVWETIYRNSFLYAYLIYTAYVCWLRKKEIKAEPSGFDYAKYTLSTGIVDKRLLQIRHSGRFATLREVETFFEPLIFFILGILLIAIGQSLGSLLVFCSIIYSLGYCSAYKQGDDRMLDIIDNSIVKEELMEVIIEGRDKAETRGFQFYGRTPNDRDSRQKAASAMAGDDDFEEVE